MKVDVDKNVMIPSNEHEETINVDALQASQLLAKCDTETSNQYLANRISKIEREKIIW